jgi:hypothetical protein
MNTVKASTAKHMPRPRECSVEEHAGHEPPCMSIPIATGRARSRSSTTSSIASATFMPP